MSLPRPSGLKAPSGSKLARPSTGIPQKSGLMPPGSISRTQSATVQSARVGEKYGTDALGEEDIAPKMDDFIVGDRVYVSGSKAGIVAYIGETQFAPGDWAGVVLDETIGKNDGSVNGVRYFQCEPKHGVFCRVSKLSRTPDVPGTLRSTDDGASVASMPVNGDNTPVNKRPTTPSMHHRPTTPSHGERSMLVRPTTPTSLPRPMNKSLSSSNTSLNRGPPASKVKSDSQMSTASTKSSPGLKIGERVLVSGSKLGTLRYLGPTDFAKGDWAGVELDDPVGKNDGAVAGKRYFNCRPRYGLFAPEHKVSKTSVTSTPSSMTRSLPGGNMRLSRERSGSQESVSSLSSATSSASRPRVRLGVSGLGNNQPTPGRTSQRPSSLNVSATTSALQKALKEKEEHIEQLLRERDLERSEVARAAAQVDEAQDQLTQLRAERERQQDEKEDNIQQLRAKIQKLLAEKNDLELKLDDEKRKVEDLQFQIEEEVISKDDLESKTEEEEAKIRDLEKCLKREKERSEKLEGEVTSLKKMKERQENQMKEMEDTQTSYLDQIEELTHKFAQAEIKIQTYDSSRLEEGAKTSQVSLELEEKSAKVSELEDFLSLKTKEVKQLQEKLSELKDDLESRNSKMEKLQNNYDELMGKLKANEVFSNNLSIEVQDLKLKNSDLERQLKDSLDKSKQLNEEKSQMELQIADMMKNSGDSSNQLSMLNDQLGQKTRKLEELQADLSTSTQKWHNLNSQFENSMKDKDKTIENLKSSYEEKISTLNVNVEDVQKELGKAKNKIVNMEKDFEAEKDSLIQRKDNEISELKQQLENVNEKLSDQEIQTQAHKQLLDKITMEKEAVQFEREKVEKQVKRLETERDSLNNDLIQVKVDAAKTKTTLEELTKEKSTVNDKIQDLVDEKQKLEKTISDLQKSRDDVINDKDKISTEKDQYQREVMEGRASLQQKDMLVEELQKEVERLKQESSQQKETINQLSQQTTDSGVMQKKIAEQTSLVETLKSQLAEKDNNAKEIKEKCDDQESQLRSMKIELEDTLETVTLLEENVKSLETDKEKVLALNKKLNDEIESIHQSHRSEVEGLKSMEQNLQTEISNTKSMFQQKEDELRAKVSQITNLENEKLMLIGYKSANEKLEEETLDLRGKINQLQTKLADVQTNANVITKLETTTNNNEENNTLVDQLMEDKMAAQGQVEFLNSVIVDLQHKNDELKTRLEIMEQGVPNGEDEMEIHTPTRRAAPRMYCDICDIFDKHETEDCPLQESSDSPPPSQYHGDRHQIRPYCDICEEFHPPCPGLSAKKVVAASGAEPIDPKAKVEDWVKTVDTVTSELASESEKVFGNDGEFFHVQQDQHEAPGFRDSGYYDSVDSNVKSPFDVKPGLSLLSSVSEITEAEKQNIWDKLKKEATKSDLKVLHVSDKESPVDQKQKESSNEVNRKRPKELGTLGNSEDKGDYSQSTKTPLSITSMSDSEYQSGIESLNSQSESPGTPDETSVDTGEVFPSDEQKNDDQNDADTDKAAENCVVS